MTSTAPLSTPSSAGPFPANRHQERAEGHRLTSYLWRGSDDVNPAFISPVERAPDDRSPGGSEQGLALRTSTRAFLQGGADATLLPTSAVHHLGEGLVPSWRWLAFEQLPTITTPTAQTGLAVGTMHAPWELIRARLVDSCTYVRWTVLIPLAT